MTISTSFIRDGHDDHTMFATVPRALRTETRDAAGGTGTSYEMNVGDTFNGALTTYSDSDWVRVNLQAGSYVVSLDGRQPNAVLDPILRFFDSNGSILQTNDDGGAGFNSRMLLNITQSGIYYISAAAYAGGMTGNYSLGLAPNITPTFTMAQIAHQLTDGYWQHDGGTRRSFDVAPGQALNVDVSDLTAAGRRLALAALQAWTDVTGIKFNANPARGQEIDIRFDDSDAGAYSSSSLFGTRIDSSFVNVGLDWLASYGTGFDTYSYQTYIHEIGHALGLGHAGNYNGFATYGQDNHYTNDSWQASIMSYFNQEENTWVNASYAYIMTAMKADILAMRTLYGVAELRVGNTVYGEESTAGGSYKVVSDLLRTGSRDDIAFTILDSGGHDLLNLSSDTTNQRIDLTPGAISDAYGAVGNISIMGTTLIENMRAGSGHDRIVGNGQNNTLWGNLGNDHIVAGAGNDVLVGGHGRDTLVGGGGNDTYFTDGQDLIVEAANGGRDTVVSAVSITLGNNLEDLRLTSGGVQNGDGNQLANTMTGNAFANQLRGYGGNDVLIGGGGHDTLIGGMGADVFVFNAGRDVIRDFQNDVDTIQIDDALWGGAMRSVAQVLQLASVIDGDVVLRFGNGHSLTVENLGNIGALNNDLIII